MKTRINKLLILAGLILTSCTPEEVPAIQKDCNCDKVVDRSIFNSQGRVFGYYTTINECTGLQNTNIPYVNFIPKIGDCK